MSTANDGIGCLRSVFSVLLNRVDHVAGAFLSTSGPPSKHFHQRVVRTEKGRFYVMVRVTFPLLVPPPDVQFLL